MGPKHEGYCTSLDEEDAQALEAIFVKHRLESLLSVDRDRLSVSQEAWVHVVVSGDDVPVFADFGPYPRPGILTWTNSD